MRPLIAFLFILFNLPRAEAQINLVPNPSFEDTVYCPFGVAQIDAALGWSSYRDSPDYFNGCSSNIDITTPNGVFGYQHANTGIGYVGIITYRKNNSPTGNNYREYIGAELTTTLQIGTKYFFSFYAVSAEKTATGFFSNNIGLRFLTNSYSIANAAPLDNYSHLKFDSILMDTINWNKISGSFVADSNYSYVSIGNYYNSQQTDTLVFFTSPNTAYYFIDDVCVTSDSLYNETWTGINDVLPGEIKIWPNPVEDNFQYKSNQRIDEIRIFDIRWKLIKVECPNSMEGIIKLGVITKGIYFASFKKEKNISFYKFIKL